MKTNRMVIYALLIIGLLVRIELSPEVIMSITVLLTVWCHSMDVKSRKEIKS